MPIPARLRGFDPIDWPQLSRVIRFGRADDHAPAEEFAHGVGHIGTVAPEAVEPSHDEDVPRSQDIGQAPTLRPIREPGGDARHAMIVDERSSDRRRIRGHTSSRQRPTWANARSAAL